MRKFLFFLILVIIGLSYVFEIDELIARKLSFFNDVKTSYINKIISVSNTVEKYFNQSTAIERLQKENEELKPYKFMYEAVQNEFNTLQNFVNMEQKNNQDASIKLTKVVSYINYNDFTKVWLDQDKKDDAILGLISQGYAAGIVINDKNRSVALLNGNKDSSYAVFIGKNKIPGIITTSKNSKILTIKYIPVWSEIKDGDEVVTSGMDNIFFEGLKVGKIIKVLKQPDMQVARVEAYADVLKKKYFYTYRHPSNNIETSK